MRHDHAEAERLAARIRAFWQGQGYTPAVWVEDRLVTASAGDAERRLPIVCSDMVGGWPKSAGSAIRSLSGQPTTACPVCRWWQRANTVSGLTERRPAPNAGWPVVGSPNCESAMDDSPKASVVKSGGRHG